MPESCGFQQKLFLPGQSEVPRNDTFPRDYKDQGSNLRMMIWARIGIDIVSEEKCDWVDETPDMSHYYMTD